MQGGGPCVVMWAPRQGTGVYGAASLGPPGAAPVPWGPSPGSRGLRMSCGPCVDGKGGKQCDPFIPVEVDGLPVAWVLTGRPAGLCCRSSWTAAESWAAYELSLCLSVPRTGRHARGVPAAVPAVDWLLLWSEGLLFRQRPSRRTRGLWPWSRF